MDEFLMQDDLGYKYLIFNLDESYALELTKVLEIVELSSISKVPETPDYILGIMNLRGHVLPIIDLRLRFKRKTKERTGKECVIIIDFDGNNVGIIADTVVDLISIPPESIAPPPQVGSDYSHVFVKGIGIHGDEMKLILDCDKIIYLNDLDFVKEEKK